MGWIYVFLAAILELVGVIGLNGFSQKKSVKNFILVFVRFGGAFVSLYKAFIYLPVIIAYAVWIGIGTAAAFIVNMVFYGESKSCGRVVSLVIIIIGVVGLKAVS